jgi:hypothetical protein
MTILPCRRSARRLALLGAAALALGALASAPAAGAATSPSPRPLARAAAPPFVHPMAQALARVHSYQLTLRTATSGSGSPLSATSTGTVLRRGQTLRLLLTTTTQQAGHASTLQEVFTGTHLCVRLSGQRAWSCSAAPSSTLARLRGVDPAQMAQTLGLGQRYVAVGRHSKQGQACLGYRFSLTAGGVRGQSTLWIAQATALPVEEDAVSTLALRPGTAPLVMRMTQVWSRWNDLRLTIPSVPAS